MLCFRKFLVAKNCMDKKGGGGSIKIFRRKFFVSQYRNILLRKPSMLCFRKFLVAKKCMDEREGEISRIPSKIFCLIVPKNAVEEPFSLSLISGTEEIWMRGWGECQDIPSTILCITVAKIFVEEPFRAVVSVSFW